MGEMGGNGDVCEILTNDPEINNKFMLTLF